MLYRPRAYNGRKKDSFFKFQNQLRSKSKKKNPKNLAYCKYCFIVLFTFPKFFTTEVKLDFCLRWPAEVAVKTPDWSIISEKSSRTLNEDCQPSPTRSTFKSLCSSQISQDLWTVCWYLDLNSESCYSKVKLQNNHQLWNVFGANLSISCQHNFENCSYFTFHFF